MFIIILKKIAFCYLKLRLLMHSAEINLIKIYPAFINRACYVNTFMLIFSFK